MAGAGGVGVEKLAAADRRKEEVIACSRPACALTTALYRRLHIYKSPALGGGEVIRSRIASHSGVTRSCSISKALDTHS